MMKVLDKGTLSAFRYKYNFFKSLTPLQIDMFNPTYFTDWFSQVVQWYRILLPEMQAMWVRCLDQEDPLE